MQRKGGRPQLSFSVIKTDNAGRSHLAVNSAKELNPAREMTNVSSLQTRINNIYTNGVRELGEMFLVSSTETHLGCSHK